MAMTTYKNILHAPSPLPPALAMCRGQAYKHANYCQEEKI